MSSVSEQYRRYAGLDERKSDAPETNTENKKPRAQKTEEKPEETTEPEGGYSGGIRNTGAINSSEQTGAENGKRQAEAAAKAAPAEGLTGGETATEVARATGEDTVDVKPAGETETEKPAKKTAAKGKK